MLKRIVCFMVICIAVCAFAQTASAKNVVTYNDTDYSIQVAEMLKTYFTLKTQVVDDNLYIIGKSSNEVSLVNFEGMTGCVVGPDNRFVLAFNNSQNLENALSILKLDDDIVYAHRDCVIKLQEDNSESDEIIDSEEIELGWGKSALKISNYIDYLKENNDTDDVIIAVVDSGVSNIDFLSEKLVPGYDFIKNTSNANGGVHPQIHGTCLASIIADCTRGVGVYIMPVRVMAYSTGSLINVVNGILYSADNGADIINVSIGGRITDCAALDDAVSYAYSKGCVVVVSAGNDSSDVDGYCPSHNQSAITVSSIDESLNFADSFSNYGNTVDFAAPGINIKGYDRTGKLTTLSGTSMSAAYISSCIGLMKYSNRYTDTDELVEDLKKACFDLGDTGWDKKYGFGIPQMDSRILNKEVEIAPILMSTNIISKPHNIMYRYKSDGTPVLDGLVIRVDYSDGTYKFIEDFSAFNIDNEVDTSKIGYSTFRISYEDIVVEYEVEVYFTWWQLIMYYIFGGWIWEYFNF